MIPLNTIQCRDCKEGMREIPDKSIDLVITDPPYGINAASAQFTRQGKQTGQSKCVSGTSYTPSEWDKMPPTKEYFDEIFRISKNQIIFGGQHFIESLSSHSCWLVWDKDNGENLYADAELAWTSFDSAVRVFKWKWHGMLQEDMAHKEERVHPTQKPVKLFEWIIKNYAKEGDTICDPFLGSGTTMIACENLGRKCRGCEIDPGYVAVELQRYKDTFPDKEIKLIS